MILSSRCDSSIKYSNLLLHADLHGDKCYSPSDVPVIFQKYLRDTSDLYHVCQGCFHKVVCQHVCAKKMQPHLTENEAAIIIQRNWKK